MMLHLAMPRVAPSQIAADAACGRLSELHAQGALDHMTRDPDAVGCQRCRKSPMFAVAVREKAAADEGSPVPAAPVATQEEGS